MKKEKYISTRSIVHEPFPIPIIQTRLDIDNKIIKEFCLETEQNTSGVVRSNIGGYQSPDVHDPYVSKLGELIQEIDWTLREHIDVLIYPPPLSVVNIWCNINYYKDTNATHLHPHSVYSGVYYVQTPKDCGRLCIQHPALDLLSVWEGRSWEDANFVGEVEEGTVYLFPSWLKHYVEPNMNIDEKRISISFNIHR